MVDQLMLPFAREEIKIARMQGNKTKQYIRFHELIKLIGVPIHKTTLWRWEKNDYFPKRIKLGDKTIAWLKSEVEEWCAERVSERNA